MFDFNEVEIEKSKFEDKYLHGGNHNVSVSEIKSGLSSAKQSPFVELVVADNTGKTASKQFYLNGGAFNISANALFNVIAAVNNLDLETNKDEIKAKLGSISNETELAKKLSTMLVGKPFAIHLDEEWINPTDTSKKPWKKAVFGTGTFAVHTSKASTLSTTVKVKGEAVSTETTTVPATNW